MGRVHGHTTAIYTPLGILQLSIHPWAYYSRLYTPRQQPRTWAPALVARLPVTSGRKIAKKKTKNYNFSTPIYFFSKCADSRALIGCCLGVRGLPPPKAATTDLGSRAGCAFAGHQRPENGKKMTKNYNFSTPIYFFFKMCRFACAHRLLPGGARAPAPQGSNHGPGLPRWLRVCRSPAAGKWQKNDKKLPFFYTDLFFFFKCADSRALIGCCLG